MLGFLHDEIQGAFDFCHRASQTLDGSMMRAARDAFELASGVAESLGFAVRFLA
jgi:hypothetical protein